MFHYKARDNKSTMTKGQRHFPNYDGLGGALKNNSKVRKERLKSAKFHLHNLRLHVGTGDNLSKVLRTVSAACGRLDNC